ncbi:MAG: phosphatase PAP2 family protein [Planctomycetota bacterium]|nr:phosphatase PAP2 family protein [Planctomycetota bacterium]
MPFAGVTLGVASWDQEILHAINCGLSGPWADAILLTLQRSVVGIAAMLIAIGLVWDRDRRVGLQAFVTALAAYGLCMGVADLAWHAHYRARPGRAADVVLRSPAEIATCERQPQAVVVRKHVSRRSGMPSRHALSSGVFAATMLLASRGLGLVACLYALLVAMARVYSGVHWPSDVLVGLAVGGAAGWLVWRSVPWVFGRFGRRRWVEDPAMAPESTSGSRPEDTPG